MIGSCSKGRSLSEYREARRPTTHRSLDGLGRGAGRVALRINVEADSNCALDDEPVCRRAYEQAPQLLVPMLRHEARPWLEYRYSQPGALQWAFWGESVEDRDRRGDHRGPEAPLVAYRRLRDVCRADDLVGDAVDFFLLVPGAVGIELYVQRCRQHFRG